MPLKNILRKHKLPLSFTLALVLTEALLTLLFPLFIGHAVDGVINGDHLGVYQLGLLGLVTLLIGVGRRFFDSRFYSEIYQEIGSATIPEPNNQDTSTRTARLGMIKELIDFLEFSIPELINTVMALVGVILIMALLNINVFIGALISTLLILSIYWLSGSRILRFNKASNDELERQVAVISKDDENELKTHLKRMMKWNIKLSDLEAINFSLAWLILMVFLVVSIIISADAGTIKYGALFSLIMYVFQYMENVINLPFFYQNFLRLKEILERLNKDNKLGYENFS